MALKFLHLLSFISLIFLIHSSLNHARDITKDDQIPSPFDFLNQLKGCHKGNKTKGIQFLKHYLQQFGYLDPDQTQLNDDNFDDTVESAVKTYQQNYHINPTGELDAQTISKMISPRCGVPDIVKGINTMRPNEKWHGSGPSSIHIVSHYTFFPGSPRWPPSKTNLTYKFLLNTPTSAMAAVARAFQKWANATQFRFSQVQNNQISDLVVGFLRLSHGDGAPFDGPGGTLAHAFAPTDGRFHYDADERWSVGSVAGAFDLETVAVHEIGHLLGLGHSSVEAAIMYPSIAAGQIKNLHADDIQGIKALYNV